MKKPQSMGLGLFFFPFAPGQHGRGLFISAFPLDLLSHSAIIQADFDNLVRWKVVYDYLMTPFLSLERNGVFVLR